MHLDLSGRRALVTGGSRGLGKAVALRLARSGADVAVLARTPDVLASAVEEIRSVGKGRVSGYACDISVAEEAEETVRMILQDFEGLDILVNNAGSSFRRPFDDLTRTDMIADMDLKLFAAVRLSQLVIPGMKERRWGRIINVLSINGKAPRAGSAPTTLSRAAGMALTKAMSLELAPSNVLVNALCVGAIKSGQWERRHQTSAPDVSFDEYLKPTAQTIPLGRVGEAEEFANVACFLASGAASYITGTAINVDGGLSPVT